MGIAEITPRSFSEFCATGAGVAMGVSCAVCPNAVPQTSAQVNALASVLAVNDLPITPRASSTFVPHA